MTAKVTFFINAAVQNNVQGAAGTAASAGATSRIGGISESWYNDLPYNSNNLWSKAQEYARLRAALLPNVCAVVAIRYEDIGQLGKVIVQEKTYSGTADTIGDIPQMALRFNVHSASTGAERKFFLGAVPDARVLRGSYNPAGPWVDNLNLFIVWLQGNFLMRAIKKDVPTVAISGITAPGVVTCGTGLTVTNGMKLQVLRTVNSKDRQVGDVYTVTGRVSDTEFSLQNWNHGVTSGGKIRPYVIQYEELQVYPTDAISPRATTRKFGRPFGEFRGRASTKR
jgi:hypothetical protein